jgi:hypothetical protein
MHAESHQEYITFSFCVDLSWFTSTGMVALRISTVVIAIQAHLTITSRMRDEQEQANQAHDPRKQIPDRRSCIAKLTSSAR